MRERFMRQDWLVFLQEHLIGYPSPSNLNYFWGFGSLAGLCLVIQIVTGIILAMHYVPHTSFAFSSIEHILRDVPNGWLIRYTHSNGASIFFIVVYVHIARGLYYGSYLYPRERLWYSGIFIFILMMATAFLGYVLPWGQMSFWGATVITNFFTVIPIIGQDLVYFIWGGFSVGNPTLNRFFSLHYLLPFILVGFVGLHLTLLHKEGSSNPLSIDFEVDYIPFYPYFYVKDLFGFSCLSLLFIILVFFYPNLLGHPDNYVPANPLVTPLHIVPEWYFLPFYAILRSIPDKTGGVICMGASLIVLFFLPKIYNISFIDWPISFFYPTRTRWNRLKYVSCLGPRYLISEVIFWTFIFNIIFLGWLGTCPIKYPYIILGQISTFIYFFCLLSHHFVLYLYSDYILPLAYKEV